MPGGVWIEDARRHYRLNCRPVFGRYQPDSGTAMLRIFAPEKMLWPDYFIAKLTQASLFGADPDATPELLHCAG